MKPRASAPSTTSGFHGRARSASSSMMARKAGPSASIGMMSLKMIPGLGKSGTSRMSDSYSVAAGVIGAPVGGSDERRGDDARGTRAGAIGAGRARGHELDVAHEGDAHEL